MQPARPLKESMQFVDDDGVQGPQKPARIREEPGIRVPFEVSGDAHEPGEHGVEKDLDLDLNTRFEVLCPDQEQVKRLFETLRLFLKGVTESAQAGR